MILLFSLELRVSHVYTIYTNIQAVKTAALRIKCVMENKKSSKTNLYNFIYV